MLSSLPSVISLEMSRHPPRRVVDSWCGKSTQQARSACRPPFRWRSGFRFEDLTVVVVDGNTLRVAFGSLTQQRSRRAGD